MNNKERLPKLVRVYHSSPVSQLDKRQLPLIVDENLTLVMDLRGSGIVCDNSLIRGRELEEFTRKWSKLSEEELRSSIQISKNQLLAVLNQNVPCVGCRRSVERLYYQLCDFGHPTLEPLLVTPEGIITIQEDKCANPQVLGSIFHDHSVRLAKLIENQPKKNKKSFRCLLHSLDPQRSRPLTPAWRDVWNCMKQDCKKEVCIIEAPTLNATLKTYLTKHRFCGECRTKVLKAYTLLVEEPDPCKEKGYMSSLYSGIKRCISDKHIHLPPKTDYITKLISRAEPELMGSRRERHAKTLEIAQEEVLTCLGICMYERLHRVYMRIREEECTCQVFAAVAVDTLSRSFETAVELKQGVSQLELLYEELAKEEQLRRIRKEQKKIKRKRKKVKSGTSIGQENGSKGCDACHDEDDDDDDEDGDEEKEEEKGCDCLENDSVKCDCDPDETMGSSQRDDDCGDCSKIWSLNDGCKCADVDDDVQGKNNGKKVPFQYDNYNVPNGCKKECGSSSEHSHDCGYSSENNNGCCGTGSLVSSLSSSPEGSELACSDSCCQDVLTPDYVTHFRLAYGGEDYHLCLLEMLLDDNDVDDDRNFITQEEVNEFKNNNRQVFEKRRELRDVLQNRFAQFCFDGPDGAPKVPRLLVRSKYASN